MALKKSELYASLWESCDELRGGMDASQYKDYVLALLFVKYVSDKAANDPDTLLEVPEGGGFEALRKLKDDPEIGDKTNKLLEALANANRLEGIFRDTDFNDPNKLGADNEMVDTLTKLVAIFERLDFARNRADGDDLLGDAYEYLMRHFATESGKSKGQFYTPAEVSRVMARIIGLESASHPQQTIFDPACGSGSLLLKVHDQAQELTGVDLSIFGQEKDSSTTSLARMNMILHGCETAIIHNGNTLAAPHWASGDKLRKHDFVVANPPFSDKGWTSGLNPRNDPYGRFEGYGIPPAKGDYAYLLHIIASLKLETGKGAVILPHGVLFRGNTEADIRREVVSRGLIKGIIGLPANLFYGTGIAACLIVLDREHASARNEIFMIDASREFAKDGPKNRLRERDVHKIVDTFNARQTIEGYSRLVPFTEIRANDFNLNLPRYIDGAALADSQDIEAHLHGGIPDADIEDLGEYWAQFPNLRAALFGPLRPGFGQVCVENSQIKSTILNHPQWQDFAAQVHQRYEAWRAKVRPQMDSLSSETALKSFIADLSESLLEAFEDAPVVDAYAIYQHLMSFWAQTFQDDVYLITQDGWTGAAKLRRMDQNGNKSREKPDFVVGKVKYKADLLPPSLLISHYFSKEQSEIETLEARAGEAAQAVEELVEEHGAESGALDSARDSKDKITEKSVKARLKDIAGQAAYDDERLVLKRYLELGVVLGQTTKALGDARKKLDERVFLKYPLLSESEIKVLAIDEKWLAHLAAGVESELERAGGWLSTRIGMLARRYETPLPTLHSDLETLEARVKSHLSQMGFSF